MHFTVSCTSCQTEFPIDSDKVPAQGIHARCSVCAEVFLVESPSAEDDVASSGLDELAIEPSSAGLSDDPPQAEADEVVAEPSAVDATEVSAAREPKGRHRWESQWGKSVIRRPTAWRQRLRC